MKSHNKYRISPKTQKFIPFISLNFDLAKLFVFVLLLVFTVNFYLYFYLHSCALLLSAGGCPFIFAFVFAGVFFTYLFAVPVFFVYSYFELLSAPFPLFLSVMFAAPFSLRRAFSVSCLYQVKNLPVSRPL